MASEQKSGTKISWQPSKTSLEEEEWYIKPEFIYGGPFIPVKKPSPFLDTRNPLNVQLQGTFKRSFAYYSLKERLPTILTKIIDYLSRESSNIKSIHNANDEDIKSVMRVITKIKSDLITNKEYEPFTVQTPEAELWNTWIFNLDNKKYFFNTWVFSECYVYRKLKEACELTETLKEFDYFEEQKKKSLDASEEFMCIVADRLVKMLPKSELDDMKADLMLLLKLCLWSNKCDLSLSLGEPVNLGGGAETETKNCVYTNPFQMLIDFKDKVLVDDTKKISDQFLKKAEMMATKVQGQTTPPKPPPPLRGKAALAAAAAAAEAAAERAARGEVEEEKPPVIPCPAKFAVPSAVYFDIVCDNAGYELFTDLCLAHFVIAQGIVEKVRFHVKKMPWFVSDVTPKDFQYLIAACMNSEFHKLAPSPPPEPEEIEPQPELKKKAGKPVELADPLGDISSDSLKSVAAQWNQYVEDGVFIVLAEDYWTYPHVYKDMKKYDPNLYRKLQTATAIVFKGDLNYRKLVGERCCSPSTGFESNLQGFVPAPIIAIRTVKAETVCGVNKKKYDQATNSNPNWMTTGDYGVIQYCKKGEALKASPVPCLYYGDTCHSLGCPAPSQI